MPRLGIIGGSGLYDISGLTIKECKEIATPFGGPSDVYRIGEFSGVEVVFLQRHGTPHHISPHKINYRANIWGFKELGVERIISISAAGGISSVMEPSSVVVLDQIIDMTKGRPSTFYDSNEVLHIDFTEPYCRELRETIFTAAEKAEVGIKRSGTYICVEGPRLETAAEIKVFSMLGADVVGMTGMPEASLAREVEICLAGIAVVTNYAAGIITGKKLTTMEVLETMKATTEKLKSILKEVFTLIPSDRTCACKDALKEARM
ncbi:MAG: S-methyl-5'-thioadenosine phosphorylase [Nitrospirota bacterium]